MASDQTTPDTEELDLNEIYPFAIQLGKDAGAVLLKGLERRRAESHENEEQVEKMNAVDIVTEVDHGA
jgi:myo-inositol-1(or 4)-monophosphatase